MKRKLRILVIATAALGILLALTIGGAFYAMQTSWFKDKIRQRMISSIQRASGGSVELGSFSYDWRSLTAEFRDLVVHGTEPAAATPLFRASSIRIGLKITSALKRNVDIRWLIVERPELHIVIEENGATNVPSPALGRMTAKQTLENLISLKIGHFELRNGKFETNARAVPIDTRGDDAFVVLTYNRAGPRYDAQAKFGRLEIEADRVAHAAARVRAAAQIERDRILIQRSQFLIDDSTLEAEGAIQHFAQPVLDFKIAAQLAAQDLSRMASFAGLSSGRIFINGKVRRDYSTRIAFSGVIKGLNMEYRSRSFVFKNAEFASNVTANEKRALLKRLTINALGARLEGEGDIEQYRDLRFDGNVSGLSLEKAVSLLGQKAVPYGGVAKGHVRIEGLLNRQTPGLFVASNLRLNPARSGIPVSGNLEFSYAERVGSLEFGNSHLGLPNTEITFSGDPKRDLQVNLDSSDLNEIRPAMVAIAPHLREAGFPSLRAHGSAHFTGVLSSLIQEPSVNGEITLTNFQMGSEYWDLFRARITASGNGIEFSRAALDGTTLHGTGAGHVGLVNWAVRPTSPLRLHAQFSGVNLSEITHAYTAIRLPAFRGIAAGAADLNGSVGNPHGTAQLTIKNVDLHSEMLNQVRMALALGDRELSFQRGEVRAGAAVASFSAIYTHSPGDWTTGQISVRVDSNGFPLSGLASVKRYQSGLDAQLEIHGQAAARIKKGQIEPLTANGTAMFRRVSLKKIPLGDITFKAITEGQVLETSFSGDLRGSHISGEARVQLVAGNPASGQVYLTRIDLATIAALVNPVWSQSSPFSGYLSGGMSFEGPLQKLDKMRGRIEIQQFELTSNPGSESASANHNAELVFRNVSPIVLEAANGSTTIRSFQITGKDTNLKVTGSMPYIAQRTADLHIEGSLDFQFFQLLDPNVRSSGISRITAFVRGTVDNPRVNGTADLTNGAFSMKDLPNRLTAVNGRITFDRNRATIEKLTAQTGGGQVSLGGFLTFGTPGLVYRLEAHSQNVRVRTAAGISVTGNSQLRWTGTSENSTLSGTTTISRVVFSQSTDFGTLLAALATPSAAPANERDFLTGMQFDIALESAPSLQFETTLSRNVQADIDLRLRGTPSHPILLGTISANQGDIRVFGAKYSINRGEVSFVNPIRIDPVLNLDVQTVVRGITVDITISGTLGRLNINYRSDPPLQPRDIIALLTIGRTPEVGSTAPTSQLNNDVTALQSSANTVLGQAVAPSSGPLSKLFGVTNIRIDPMALQGISTTAQARLTVEQNISRQITVTYVTNLSQTAEQIFRLEWALSPEYSIVALRDDNGEFGIDIQYRKRFK